MEGDGEEGGRKRQCGCAGIKPGADANANGSRSPLGAAACGAETKLLRPPLEWTRDRASRRFLPLPLGHVPSAPARVPDPGPPALTREHTVSAFAEVVGLFGSTPPFRKKIRV